MTHARFAQVASRIAAVRSERSLLVKQFRQRRDERDAARGEVEVAKAAHTLLVGLADSCRDLLRVRVERTVTLALQAVFGRAYRFRFDVDVVRGTVALYPRVSRDGGKNWYGTNALAGGVIDIVGFALRVTLLMWHTPRPRKVFIADEPFRHVSNTHLPAVAGMLATLAEATGIQFIIVSHEPELAESADRVIRVERDDGQSIVREVVR